MVGGEEISVSVMMVLKGGVASLSFDRFMKMELNRSDGKPCELNYNADKLFGVRERSTALRVLLALDAEDFFAVAGREFSCSEISVTPEVRKDVEEELENLNKIVGLLNRLHVKEDLVISQLSAHDSRELNTLYNAIMDNRLVKPDSVEKEYQVINVSIGPLTIKVWLVKEGNAYRTYDFFTADFVVAVAMREEDSKHEVARFVFLEKKDYIRVSNIDWTLVPGEYARIYKGDVELLHQANQDVLKMLLAYDECGKKDILDAAIRLLGWMIGVSCAEEKAIYRVNYLQCIKRQREFNLEERQELISLSESASSTAELKYCCALLLDDLQRASYHFHVMSKDNQDFYKTLPINHFYKLLRK